MTSPEIPERDPTVAQRASFIPPPVNIPDTQGLLSYSELTGRFLVLFREDAVEEGLRVLEDVAGVPLSDVAPAAHDQRSAYARVFHRLGAAVCAFSPGQLREIASATSRPSSILAIEPERYVYAFEQSDPAYLRGYRDGVEAVAHLSRAARPSTPAPIDKGPGTQGPLEHAAVTYTSPGNAFLSERDTTWGLQALHVGQSSSSGTGVRVAILDTGAPNHPDLDGRIKGRVAFVPEPDLDNNGHATHCAGLAGGPVVATLDAPRYGVAPNCELFVAKVLGDAGRGRDEDVLAGLMWALDMGCAVASISLGTAVPPGQPVNIVFEGVARRCLAQGLLIVAAAGNESFRPYSAKPIAHPANCPSIMAVGAIDSRFQLATFSNGIGPVARGHGLVVAPGVEAYSCYPYPQPTTGLYRRLSGTSMACAYAAGVAALWAEHSGTRGHSLWDAIISGSRRLSGGELLLTAPG